MTLHASSESAGNSLDRTVSSQYLYAIHRKHSARKHSATCCILRLVAPYSGMSLQRTPLFYSHQKLGAKLIEFGGWEMPVHYTSIVDEHLCVRRAAGVFDICHMGEVYIEGPDALAFLNSTFTNDVRKLTPGLGQYSQMCTPEGGTVDDLYIYQLTATQYLLIINASRIPDDTEWIESALNRFPQRSGVHINHASKTTGALALQGPRVVSFIDKLFQGAASGGYPAASASSLPKNGIGRWILQGQEVWVARTGYTGEDGFEVIAASTLIGEIWEKALAAGESDGVQPCGLGARDTLRTEACYPLYGHELSLDISPIEAGLGFFVAFDKGDFIGRDALLAQKTQGPTRRLVALQMTVKSAPPRPGYPIHAGGISVGSLVSGTQSPSLNNGIGLGFLPVALTSVGTPVAVEIRGRTFEAEVVKKPFYRKA